MIEGLPWPAWLGIAGVGWLLVGLCVRSLIRGDIVPRKTYEDLIDEGRIKDKHIEELTTQNSMMLTAFGPTLTDFLRGLRKAANIESSEFRDGD